MRSMMRQVKHPSFALAALLVVQFNNCVVGQTDVDAKSLRKGRGFIETKTYTVEEDRELLAEFEGLRVADISDGMDQVGLGDVGLVSADIGPLWKDTQLYTHRIIGVAVTARYVPTNQPRPAASPIDEFDEWVGETYTKVTSEPFVPL